MKNLKLLLALIFTANIAFAQFDLPPVGGNPRATIIEEVGITSITINYSRPDVNGREGKIWGTGNLVPTGFSSGNFITNKPTSPWRAGANETTKISFEHDVKIEGKDLKAGTYGLFIAMGNDNATIIFSSQTEAWGSFYYEEKNDILRVDVKPMSLDKSVEYLKYEFIEHKEKSCTIALQWEKLSIPFKVEVDVEKIVYASAKEQANGYKGFNTSNMVVASQYFISKGIYLEEAIKWAERASLGNNGQRSYGALSNLANGYYKMNKVAKGDSVMNEALILATNPNQFVAFARTLITQKRADKAIETGLAGQKKYGDVFAINNGLINAYSAKGDFKKAIEFAEKAIKQAPNEGAKKQIEGQITKLKEGKDIN